MFFFCFFFPRVIVHRISHHLITGVYSEPVEPLGNIRHEAERHLHDITLLSQKVTAAGVQGKSATVSCQKTQGDKG